MSAQCSSFPSSRLLIQLGVVLFFLGLLTGFAVPVATIPRMALASHLEGVMNGLFLMIVGLMWERLSFGPNTRLTAFWSIVFAAFANWFATLLSAMLGAGGAMPLAGGGVTGGPVAEALVFALLIALSISVLFGAGLLIYGLRRAQSN